MNCRRFEKSFALHVEGDLPERKRRAVDEHLAGCAACRDFAARLEASQRAVKDLRDETVDPEALEEIRRRVLARVAAVEPVHRWRFAYAAAAALAVAAVVWVSRRAPEPPPPLPRAVASMPAPAMPKAVPKPPVRRARAAPKPRAEPLLVKLETSDPNVVIYWIVESGE